MGRLSDLADAMNKSAVVNIAQLTNLDNGGVVVPIYDWQSYFSAVFTKLKGINKLHHLRHESNSPGTVFIRHKAPLRSAYAYYGVQTLCQISKNHHIISYQLDCRHKDSGIFSTKS